MIAALRSECVKAFAGRGARYAYFLLFAMTIAFSAFIASGSTTSPRGAFGDNDMVAEALMGVLTASIVAAVIGVVAIGNEYGSGMIATSLAATPRRSRVVLAKATVAWLATTLVGTAAAYAAYFAARPLQRSGGFVAPGYPDPDLTSGPVLRAMLGSGLLVGIIAVLGVGVCAIVKRTAIAIPLAIGSFTIPAMIVVNDDVTRMLQRWTPLGGFAIQHTVDRHDYFVSPWRGLAIAAAYAVVALAVGVIATSRRDV
jgi:ABC-2 type transport system permease protein